MQYLTLKLIHIISATLLFGTGLGNAYYKYMTDRTGDIKTIAITNRNVVFADWVFTTPPIILQPLTGLGLIYASGNSLSATWIWVSLILFCIAGLCWFPVVYLQIIMRNMSGESFRKKQGITRGILALYAIMVLAGCASFYINCRCIWTNGNQAVM